MSGEVLGFNVWTRTTPQAYLRDVVRYATDRELPLIGIVDDVLPEVVFGRTAAENIEMREQYMAHMQEIGFTESRAVSELLSDRSDDLARLYSASHRITISEFLSLLPEAKRHVFDTLSATEIIDTCWQMHVLEAGIAQLGITRYIMGKRSTAFYRQAKKVIPGLDFSRID